MAIKRLLLFAVLVKLTVVG